MKEHPTAQRAGSSGMHGLLIVALVAAGAFVPIFRLWPLLWLGPLAAYAALVAIIPPLRATFRPWRFGSTSKPAVIATSIVTLGSCAVLVAFHLLTRPDISAFGKFIPVTALGGIIATGVLFSIGNALLEELVFRGILYDAAESQWGAWGAVATTSFLFGYGHMHGYPPGPLGAVLAGVYGLCLGVLRKHTGGFGLCVLSHIAADATIYTLVARSGVLGS